ncbi:hypothetical protein JG687_00001543 [Phytophthora cactorum]|uniref:SP-RING-type domain-containing protein n=2 Tax=Phytophthora cactorum TaxID=29920 RepID=A0A329SZ49_9STRA|nr:hypothetical protein Pcac1_g6516 [Phytophthora cactorum]KAG2822651.1 hypothetical protein PC112_g10855 [Phytophthora cactorum]KAG2846632.1 hypothetical protein PC111_g1132 [Phytophthora cactorum]KAG2866204.1 hypothetical protein PC113_g3048 [Phytophthora cactorum]KAG2904506.1 hypothetical protein PC114_g11846 [Phytophthora cactorum]
MTHMHQRPRSQQQQTVVDLTAQMDIDTLQPREHGAHDRVLNRDNSNPQLIDLTDDSTTASPGQVPSRNSIEEQQIPALHRALDQANNNLATFRDSSRQILDEQEAALTCPISYELFDNPVVTECCGKTFSSGALTEVLRWNPQCPVCRARAVRTHASRDMTNLVDLYQKQRSLLAQVEAGMEQSTESAERASGRQASNSSSLRRRGREERRNQRVQARSAASRPQPSSAAAPGAPAPARAQADWRDDNDDDWQGEYLWWLQTELT